MRIRNLFTGFSNPNLLSLYLPAFTLALGNGIAAPALPVFAKAFDVSFGVASLVIVVHMVGGAAATIPTGYMIDKFGRRRILLAGPLLTALASFLVASSQSFPELLAYRFLGGWASQMWQVSRLTVIADTGRSGERGRQITGMAALQRTGGLLGPALGGVTAALWGVRVPFIIHGVLAILSVIPSFRLIRETAPSQMSAPESGRSEGGENAPYSIRSLMVYPVMVLFAAQLFANFIRGAGGAQGGGPLFLYAVYAYGIDPLTLGLLASITAGIGIPITFAAGHIMDRFGRKAGVVPGTALLGIGMFFLAVTAFYDWSFLTFAAGFLWINLGMSLMSGSMQTMGSDVAPRFARGRFFGVQRLVAEVGQVLSPLTFAGIAATLGFTASFLFVGTMGFGTSLWIAVMIRETLKRR